MYFSIFHDGIDEFVEKKSKFIGHSFIVKTEDEALEKIAEIKQQYKDATHNCSAYIIGEDKLIQRYNDDGEPSGTAGIPMLEVLKKEDLTNVLVIATRYFGGTMLGAGGLVRAYTKTAKIAIDAGVVVEMIKFEKISISYDYTFHGSITNFLLKNQHKILSEEFTDRVKILLYKKIDDENLLKEILNLTSGNAEIGVECDLLLPTKNGQILY